MIDIYQKPTDKNPTLGFTFKIFSDEKFGVHHEKHSSYFEAMAIMQSCKTDVLIMNLEAFWTFCDKSLVNPTQEITDSITAIRNVVGHALDHKFKYELFLSNVIKNTNFIRALVKAVPQDKKVGAIMMAATLIGFCKDELDECKKNKS